MYHLLLTRRYLTTKILPFLATLAVLVSTATVIVAWSIMTGFLGVLLDSGRTLVGDVIISWPSAGFGHYEELIEDLERDPKVKAATPVIDILGVIKLPDNRIVPAQVKAIEPKSFDEVTGFHSSLWWKGLDTPMPKDVLGADPRIVEIESFRAELPDRVADLMKTVPPIAAKARERGAANEAATLDSALTRVRGLQKLGDDAAALPPNSEERRSATAAFVRTGFDTYTAIVDTLQTLRRGAVVADAELGAVEENDAPGAWDALVEFKRSMDAALGVLVWDDAYTNGSTMTVRDPKTGEQVPAMVIGIEFTNYNERFPEGYYVPKEGLVVRTPEGYRPINGNMLGRELTLNLLPLDASPTQFDLVSRSFPIANEMRSGLYQFDKSWVLVDLKTVQNLVRMGAAEEVEPFDPYKVESGPNGETLATPKVIRKTPARVTQVLVRGVDGVDLVALRQSCTAIYKTFAERHPQDVPPPRLINITTWEEEQATLVGAVKKEIVMVLLILGIVSITVSFLILAIFWAIVREKTKDIGILRAVGASRLSVCGLWLEYALVTGLIGAALGGLAGCSIVWNINPIHDWLGKNLGLVVWDPRIYYFFEIPNRVDPLRAVLVMVAGVGFAVLGALIPAVRAAFMDPVKSLRFE